VIVDDVITDGASKRESVELIRKEGAKPAAVLIALDRMERGGSGDTLSAQSAVMDFERDHGLPVMAIATLQDLLDFLNSDAESPLAGHTHAVARYREKYGV
jgi:orotate phosphoribosyltransferase